MTELPVAFNSNEPSARALDVMAWLRSYASERLDMGLADERRALPPHVILDFGRRGLLGLQGEAEFGGLNFSPSDCLHVAEQFGAVDLSLSISILLHNFLVTQPLRRHATPTVQGQFLPDLVSGRVLGSFCLTERSAGSDPRRLQTTAHQLADGSWRLNGEKIWSGNASWAGILLVFAKSFSVDGKEMGVSGFVVERGARGIEAGKESRTMGLRAMPQSTTRFHDTPVPAHALLGKVGEGLLIAGETMRFARLMIAAICLGTMRRCLHIASTYIRQRRVGSGPMDVNPNVLAIMESRWEDALALEALVRHAGRLLDSGRTLPEEYYTAAKIIGPEMLGRCTDSCLQLMGGRGYIETNTMARFTRDARVLRILEGPTETLTAYLGARLWNDDSSFRDAMALLNGGDRLVRVDKAKCFLQKYASEQARDKQRPVTLRAQFLLGKFAADGLALAALAQHQRATHSAVRRAEACWHASGEGMRMQITDWTPRDILTSIEAFTSLHADISIPASGEDWGPDDSPA